MEGDNELEIADDIEASGYFNLAVLNNGVTARVCEPFELPPAPRTSLFAVSNVFGWAVAATATGFSLLSLSNLRDTYKSASQRTTPSVDPHRTVEVGNGGLTFLKIGMAEKVVIAAGPALQGGVGVWRLKSLVDGSSTSPLHVFPASSAAALLDVLPNPGDRPELLALLHKDGQVTMINMETKTTIGRFGSNISAACWSVRGKQIVCGDQEGNLTQYTPEGAAKTVTQAPTSLRGRGMTAIDIRWVENTVFFVTYIDPSNPMDTNVFISTRAKDGSVTYAPILDPLMVENPDRQEARFNTWLKNWTPFKHLLLVCNATSNTISHIGLAPTEEGGTEALWSQVKNDLYTTLPLETFPLGLEVDLTATEAPSPEEGAGDVPTPMLWAYATDGTLSAWRVINSQGSQYAGIAAANDITTNEEAGAASTGAIPAAATPAVPNTSSPFSGDTQSRPAFGSPGFGAKSFSSPSSSSLGGASAFSKSTFAPAFGQSTTFGSSSSAGPAFGQAAGFGKTAGSSSTGFGAPAPAASTSTAPGGGFSGFSQQTSTGFGAMSSPASGSPFGSASAGQPSTSAFGSSSSTPAFGSTSAFGQSIKPASGTSSPFGNMSMSNTPTTEQPPKPAFGATSTFGSSNAFGSTGFGTAPAAGSSPFGSAPTTTPSKPPASGGFAGFGDASKGSGFGTFGGTAGGTGNTGFSFGQASASTSSTTSNAFGQKPSSAFGGLRDSGANGATSGEAVAKPTGLNDDDAEALEPETVSTQQGGAFDFGDDAKSDKSDDGPLKMDGFGFGTPSTPSTAPKFSPALFGSFGKIADNVKTFEDRRKSLEFSPPKIAASTPAFGKPAAAAAPASGFGAFAQSSTSSAGTAFGAKSEGESGKTAGTEEKIPAFSFANFTKPASSEGEKKDQQPRASGFGFSAFGQTAKPAPQANSKTSEASASAKPSGFSGFGQASPLGKSDGKPTFSFGKSAAPAEGSSKPTGSSAFASASPGTASPFGSSPTTSPSASPFASPSNTAKNGATTTAFGQPGFFSGFGQKTAAAEVNKEADAKTDESEPEPTAPVEKTESAAVNKEVPTPNSEARAKEEPAEEDEGAEESSAGEGEEQDEIYDGEDGEEVEEQNDEADEDDEEEGYSEGEEEYDEEQQEGEEHDDTGEVNETNVDLTPASEPPESDGGESREESRSPSPSPLPAPALAKQDPKPVAAPSQPPKPVTQSAFGFAAAPSSSTSDPDSSKTPPSFSFVKPPAESSNSNTADTPVAKEEPAKASPFGLPQVTSTAEAPKPSTSASSAPAFSFPSSSPSPATQPKEQAQQPPKPFGFSNLQKAAPRTSSPLASMPSFAPPTASAQNSQTSFDLSSFSSSAVGADSNVSTFTASPSRPPTSPFAAVSKDKPAMPSFFDTNTNGNKNNEEAPPIPKATDQQQQQQQQQKSRPQLEHRKSDTSLLALNVVPPKLSSAPSQNRVPQQQQVGKDTVNVFMTMQDQLTALKDSVSQCMDFFHSVQPARLPSTSAEGENPTDPLDFEAEAWSMGDLPRLKEIEQTLQEAVGDLTQRGRDGEKAAKSLEGSLLKTKAKTEEIARHLKAKQDPHVARLVKVRQLGPEQLENQTRIRHLNQGVNEALEELEGVITILREKVLEKKLGRTPMKAPSLDSIHRAMRNMTAALQSRILELDDTGLRLDMLTLSTTTTNASSSSPGARKTPLRNRSASVASNDSGQATPTRKGSNQVSTETEKKVERLLAAEVFGQRLKAAWLANGRTEPLLNTSANSPVGR